VRFNAHGIRVILNPWRWFFPEEDRGRLRYEMLWTLQRKTSNHRRRNPDPFRCSSSNRRSGQCPGDPKRSPHQPGEDPYRGQSLGRCASREWKTPSIWWVVYVDLSDLATMIPDSSALHCTRSRSRIEVQRPTGRISGGRSLKST